MKARAQLSNVATDVTVDANFKNIFTELDHALGLHTEEGDEEALHILEQIIPTGDGSQVIPAVTVADTAANIVDLQIAEARLDGAEGSGVAAGEQHHAGGARFWLQGFGRTASQDARGFDTPYDADSYGFVAGVDTKAAPGTVIGVALSYAESDVDSDNINQTTTEIESYQITAYGSAEFGHHNFVSGMAGYVWSDNDIARTIFAPVLPVTSRTTGDFDSNQIIVRGKVGHDYKKNNMVLAPSLLANYANYSADDYTETGAGGASLNVATEDMDLFEVGIELDAAWEFKQSGGSMLRPNLLAGYRYDVTQEEISLVSSFTGGGGAFTTPGVEPPQNKYNVGGGLKYFADGWEVTTSYTYDFMEDYDAHSGMIRIGFNL